MRLQNNMPLARHPVWRPPHALLRAVGSSSPELRRERKPLGAPRGFWGGEGGAAAGAGARTRARPPAQACAKEQKQRRLLRHETYVWNNNKIKNNHILRYLVSLNNNRQKENAWGQGEQIARQIKPVTNLYETKKHEGRSEMHALGVHK